jgi:dTDP-4-dehydrorhamnose 3,5-epimerase
MSGMTLHATPLSGLTLVETAPSTDERGRFVRVFCEAEFAALRPGLHFTQINLSTTYQRGTVRGLHCQQYPATEAKLIRCVRGRVFDVAVDLRAGSATFLQWFGVELDSAEPLQVFMPEGFAHGFQTLSDDTELLYMHTACWSPEHELGFRHDDSRLAIHWPLPVTELSHRDRNHPPIDDAFAGLPV